MGGKRECVGKKLKDDGNDEKTVDWGDGPGRYGPNVVLFEASGAGT